MVYKYYEQLNDLGTRLRVNESFFERFFTLESEVQYKEIVIREAQTIEVDGLTIKHNGFNKEPKNTWLSNPGISSKW